MEDVVSEIVSVDAHQVRQLPPSDQLECMTDYGLIEVAVGALVHYAALLREDLSRAGRAAYVAQGTG